jgi:hypothetical protein
VLFSEELLFLLGNISVVIEMNDPELVGEFLHSLRVFGVDETDPHIVAGVEVRFLYLIFQQEN